MLDCDGVLYSGPDQLGRAFDTVKYLESKGKQIFFVTNSSGKSREDMANSFKKYGYEEAKPEQMYGTAYITANYLRDKYPELNFVRVVGMETLRDALKEVGIESEGGQ